MDCNSHIFFGLEDNKASFTGYKSTTIKMKEFYTKSWKKRSNNINVNSSIKKPMMIRHRIQEIPSYNEPKKLHESFFKIKMFY